MSKFWVIVEVLYKGRELKNKEGWKNMAMLSGFTALVLKGIETFVPGIYFGDVDVQHISDGVVSIALVLGTYLIPATSSTIGIPVRSK